MLTIPCSVGSVMRILITGTSGHLGEALARTLRDGRHDVVGVDLLASPYTDRIGDIADREFVRDAMRGVEAVLHAATLHKPQVATHTRQAFVDTNISGTLNLLEESVAQGVAAFVFTSTTSAFGHALTPAPSQPAAWIDEEVACIPKNIYGISKLAAEHLCELFQRKFALPCIVLRTSRFFPEADDNRATRETYADANTKVNELLYRRADIADIVDAHLLALQKAASLGFARYIVSATTPFQRGDLAELRSNAPAVLQRYAPDYRDAYAERGWRMFPGIDRVYDSRRARDGLGWAPRWNFAAALEALRHGREYRSPLARSIGSKGYHAETFEDGPFPVD
ncbi:MAG: NAD(P)-dependent oxidoreductase [Tahibacter sp.]